jgi:nucleoid-associated protein YgaU
LPEESKSVEDAIHRGETLLSEDKPGEADVYFHLAWTKGRLLEGNLVAEKLRLADQARLKSLSEQRELERQLAFKEGQNQQLREKAIASDSAAHLKKPERSADSKEKPLPAYHTVLRSETLPLIAARSDVYNDQTLWPLLYRANRDQISDPGRIRPGQVLLIPRNVSREEIAEARRYGQEKPLH